MLPLQIKTLHDIVKVYGIEHVSILTKDVAADLLMAQLGRVLSRSIIKLIPVVGQIVGAVVNASVAGALTYALGKAVSHICYEKLYDALNGVEVDWEEAFDSDNILLLAEGYYEKKKNESEEE